MKQWAVRSSRKTPTVLAAATVLVVAAFPMTSGGIQAQGVGRHYVEGEVLVLYRPEVTTARTQQLVHGLGASVVQRFARPALERLALHGPTTEQAIRLLAARPEVALAQPNYLYRSEADPNDPEYANGDLWGLRNYGQGGGTNGCDVDARPAWDLCTGSGGVAVAVLDSGIDYNHPDLAGNVWTNPGEVPGNGVDDEGNGYVDDVHGWNVVAGNGYPLDDNYHGTHVAGTIGGTGNNAAGVVGVNWTVRLIAVKFLNQHGLGTTAQAVAGFDYVHRLKDVNGVNVVATNNSWTGGYWDAALWSAIDRSNSRGILCVAAAGNGDSDQIGDNNDLIPVYPASYDNPNVIAVTATDRNDQLATFANYGGSVDLGAPGVGIWSTTPGNAYASKNGTSMATPHVAGAIALLKAHAPGLTAAQVKDRILNTGDSVAALQGKTLTGRRLNLLGALSGGAAPPPPPPPPLPSPTLQVSVTSDQASYPRNGTAYLKARVTAGSNTVQGASVQLAVRTASGRDYSRSGTTNSIGEFTFTYRHDNRRDGRGSFTATVTASKTGFISGSGSTTFTIN